MPRLKVKKKKEQWYCAKVGLKDGKVGTVVESTREFTNTFVDMLEVDGDSGTIFVRAKSQAKATTAIFKHMRHYMSTRSVDEKSKVKAA